MLSKQYMSATSHIESSLWIEYSWLQITRTSRQLEVIFASLQIISMSLKKKRCTEIRNIAFDSIENNRVNFLSAFIFCHSSSNSVSIPLCHIKRCCLIPCSQYQSLFLAAFEVKYAWYLRSFPIHLLISGYLFRSHDNSNVFRFP